MVCVYVIIVKLKLIGVAQRNNKTADFNLKKKLMVEKEGREIRRSSMTAKESERVKES